MGVRGPKVNARGSGVICLDVTFKKRQAMKQRPKFEFGEKIKIISTQPTTRDVLGQIGAVVGKAQDENGRWSYAVWVYRDEICWSMNEEELETTGEFDSNR
jgi:hypothetical protein